MSHRGFQNGRFHPGTRGDEAEIIWPESASRTLKDIDKKDVGPSMEAISRAIHWRETSMTLIWLGVLLVFGGILQMAFQPIWRARLSGRRRRRAGQPSDTLEPERPGSGFEIKSNWLGLGLVALGAALLLAGAAI